jgi:hypothetical protein
MAGNLYNLAARVIPQQRVARYRFKSCYANQLGRSAAQYHRPKPAIDSNPELDKLAIQSITLDISKGYRHFYKLPAIYAIQCEDTADYLAFNSKLVEVTDDADWNSQDGWKFDLYLGAGNHDG